MTPAVFLDRDGTLNEDVGYLDRLERLTLFPWSIDAVRLLRRAGYAVVVVTNQGGVARGLVSESFVEEVRRAIECRLADIGERLDGHYCCPHEPHAAVAAYRKECDCRKPRPGLLHQAARELDLDIARSVVVGDKWSDIGVARAAGARGVLVRTGYGRGQEREPPAGLRAEAVTDTLMDAASWILRHPPGDWS
jgi:D-glycero-D-manno-heptose 1,7-bisphosphate phosphatase